MIGTHREIPPQDLGLSFFGAGQGDKRHIGRISAGEGPFPHGATPAVMALCVTVPMLCVAAGNAVRMGGRRGC